MAFIANFNARLQISDKKKEEGITLLVQVKNSTSNKQLWHFGTDFTRAETLKYKEIICNNTDVFANTSNLALIIIGHAFFLLKRSQALHFYELISPE